MGVAVVMAVLGTTALASLVKATIGLRPDAEGEQEGLDQIDHGEAGYHLEEDPSGLAHNDEPSVAAMPMNKAENA
jgi:ammonia channel protein AmtB